MLNAEKIIQRVATDLGNDYFSPANWTQLPNELSRSFNRKLQPEQREELELLDILPILTDTDKKPE
jgi:hypothetical protein